MNPEFSAAWSDDYALNLPEIDAQHKRLFELINAIWQATVRRAELAETLLLLDELENYTAIHFAAEEELMRLAAYPGFELHRREHQRFIARVQQEKDSIARGKTGLSLDLLRFLKDWLVKHILGTDKKYGDFYKQGGRVEESGFKSWLQRLFA